MAIPIKGAYLNTYAVPYVGAKVWGTGYNPVHMYYGSPAARLNAINPREGDVTPPFAGVPDQLISNGGDWGYSEQEVALEGQQYFIRDDRPGWDIESPNNPSRYSTDDHPPWNASGAAKTRFRAIMGGAYSMWRGKLPRADYMIPSETVSEGWVNKPTGRPANAVTPDPSQLIVQTSPVQRYRARNNDHAVARATDAARSHINSRVSGQRTPRYSEGERLYDMFPKQQHPDSPIMQRDFFYRTAGTGLQDQMQPNAMWEVNAIERTPPPDPYIGQQDTSYQYGYTPEDNFYA